MESQGTILVVDDTVASLKLMTDLLRAEGYAVRSADSGELALRAAQLEPPDLIMLDVRMPGMDGFEVFRRLKALPATHDVPVIFITASTSSDERILGLGLGAVDFVSKPFRREELLARVRTHLDLRRLRTRLEETVRARTRELQESEERFRVLVDNAPEAILVLDADTGRFVGANKKALQLTGLTQEQLTQIGPRALYALPQPDGRDVDQSVVEHTAQALSGLEVVFERIVSSADGRQTHCEVRLVRLPATGANLIRSSFIDISERKLVEAERERARAHEAEAAALRELDRLKGEFVNSVSHELRSPLTVITGYVELLEDEVAGTLNPQQLQYVDQIEASARRLERLVDDLIDYARIEAGVFTLRRAEADFAQSVQGVVESLRLRAEETGVHLAVDLPASPLLIPMDPQRIQQVLSNLLDNALKHTPRGGVTRIRVTTDADRLRCEVIDTGTGIAPEDISKLFQRFSQLDEGRKKGGTGLGLSICQSLVHAHGGQIGVDSSPGAGSTFWFTLPLTTPTAEEHREGEASRIG